ncbi:hypothetical protein KY342_06495 [Candidatus Woesearchaeota archaeon]|nr:hypothetical protein [Candidatus Woesearchaeota archaeon]
MGEQEEYNEMMERTAEANGSDVYAVRNGNGEIVNLSIKQNKFQQNVGEENKMTEGDNGHDGGAPDFQPDFVEGGEGKLTMVAEEEETLEEQVEEEGNASMGGYNAEQARVAQEQLAEETDSAYDGYLQGVRDSKKEKEKEESNGVTKNKAEDDIKAKLRRMNAQLEEDLAPLLKEEEARLQDMQYKGILGRLQKVLRISPKTVDKNKVLDNVITNLLYEAEEIVERRKIRMSNRKSERDEINGKARHLTKLSNTDYDKHESGEKFLESIQEQYTRNNQARNDYIGKKAKPGYDKTIDNMLSNTVATIERLEQKRIEIEEGQEVLYENIQDYNAKLDVIQEDVKEANVHYFIAKEDFQSSRKARDDLLKMRDDRNRRESLLSSYIEKSKEDAPLKHAKSVSKGAREVITSIIERYADEANASNGVKSPGSEKTTKDPFRQYEATMQKKREDVLAKAKARRYALTN